jgi:hypothetical protein
MLLLLLKIQIVIRFWNCASKKIQTSWHATAGLRELTTETQNIGGGININTWQIVILIFRQ